ncbi:hypothetical protein BASA81_001532 [Batrachochytrium salamandrivorans]|nr:hypothetical protein BASA81_001532 [Batrachochytrium salamandrivorans]
MSEYFQREETKHEDEPAAAGYLAATKKNLSAEGPTGSSAIPSSSTIPPSSSASAAAPQSSSMEPETTVLKSAHAPRTPTMGEDEEDKLTNATTAPKEEEAGKKQAGSQPAREDEEEATKAQERSYPVLSALVEGSLLGWVASLVLYPEVWVWALLMGALTAATMASREDMLGRRVRRYALRVTELTKSLACQAVEQLKSLPSHFEHTKEKLAELDHTHEVSNSARAVYKERIQPKAQKLGDKMSQADTRGLLPKAKSALCRVDQATGLSRTGKAIWRELMQDKQN